MVVNCFERNHITFWLFIILGEYLVSVKFNDQHIPDSPFRVFLAPSTGEIQKLNVSDLQEHGLQVRLAFRLLFEMFHDVSCISHLGVVL